MNLKQFYVGRSIGFIVVLILVGLFATYKYLYSPKEVEVDVLPQTAINKGIDIDIVTSAEGIKEINTQPVSYICKSDGKICPDGSTVGRAGANCQFTACPIIEATTTIITTTIGQVATGLHVSITPNKIVSDSRCPQSVQCIWAGTVEVKAVVATKDSNDESIFKLGEATNDGAYTITLTEVTPYPLESGVVPDSSYRFTFKVDKK